MTYQPISLYSIKSSDEIAGVAIAKSMPPRSELHLFTGGEFPWMMFLTGEYKGKGFEAKSWQPTNILAIEGDIEFEVEPESMETATLIEQPIGALVLAGAETGVIMHSKDGHGFPEAVEVFFGDAQIGERERGSRVYFTKWRAVKWAGSEKHVLFEMDSTERAR